MEIKYIGREDAVKMELKSLYMMYGYDEYRLSGFEEYSFYAENESFLNTKDVIAVNAGGKLLALRSDVTLSIAKNIDIPDKFPGARKLFYDEKVFRKAPGGGINEISQIGIEIMGTVDRMATVEVCQLIDATLSRVSPESIVDISHMGIIVKALKMLCLDPKDEHLALECLKGKNTHDFMRLMQTLGRSEREYGPFLTLISLPSSGDEAVEKLKEIKGLDISAEVAELEDFLLYAVGDMQVDFSIVGDYNYYNGIIFKGYVQGIPKAVLSGGRYDKLLEKFGKKAQAIGFALYVGEIDFHKYAAKDEDRLAACPYPDDSYESVNTAMSAATRSRMDGRRVLVTHVILAGFDGDIIDPFIDFEPDDDFVGADAWPEAEGGPDD
ncbi:MAG: ATP phosphoribosyltransferase regulatory subunit [Clostridia bacterium]|nr:ATP phosphoribosyltransferase regulatory subunit [Clostridia bacterium]